MSIDAAEGQNRTLELEVKRLREELVAREQEVASLRALVEGSETALRRFHQIIQSTPVAVSVAPISTGLLDYVNPAYCQLLGYTEEELVGMPLPQVFGEDPGLIMDLFQQCVAGGSWQGELRYRRKDGTSFPAHLVAHMLYDAADAPIAAVGFVHDLTAQKQREEQVRLRAEADLRAGEQRNKALLEAIPDLMFLFSPEGVFLDYRADQTGDLAIPPEVFLHRRADEVLPPPLATQMLSHLAEIQRTGEPQVFEYQLALPDGMRDYEARMVLSNNNVLTLAREITDRKRADQERQALQEQVIAAQQAALRELSTPLMPIADGVVVMPIIGTIDSMRAQQVMETLLEGIAAHNAAIAILDITGVKVVDTQVAGALIRAAQATRMLGAQVVLTGISPEIAQTLVHIGVELHDMVAKRNLRQGITYALELRG